VSENTGAHVAVELQHVIVTDRQLPVYCVLSKKNTECNFTWSYKEQGKHQDKMCWKPW